MSSLGPPTKEEVQQLAADWYSKLDVHAPMVDILPLLATEELEMKFPEATLRNLADFESWYQRVIRIFFDEVHQIKKCEVKVAGDKANVDIIVKWEASVWNPPVARSQRIMLDAYQTWCVKRSQQTGRPVIVYYGVDDLKYHEGSVRL